MAKDEKAISKIPTAAVKNLGSMKVTRTSKYLNVSAKWDFPNTAFDKKRDDRFEGVLVRFQIDTKGIDDSTLTIKNSGKKNASISGVSGKYKDFQRNGEAKSQMWKMINRKEFYPVKNNNLVTYKQAKVYTIVAKQKDIKWNKKTKRWTIPAKGLTAKWVAASTITKKKIPTWATVSARVTKPKTKSQFYKSLTAEKESRYVVSKGKKQTRVDGIAVTVQGWNQKSAKNTKYILVKKPAKNPSKAGYYQYDKTKNPKYFKTTDTKVAKGRKYYTRKDTVKFVNTVPKQIAYFNFLPPDNPSLKFEVKGEGTNHNLVYNFESKIDSSSKKERYDTHYELYYSRGIKSSAKAFYQAGPNKPSRNPTKISAYSKNDTRTKFTLNVNPNNYLKKVRAVKVTKDGKTKTEWQDTYVSGLQEGEWIQFDLYYYNRGIAGPSVNTKKGKYQGADPVLGQMKKQSYLFAWPYETIPSNPIREGQHYRIPFKVAPKIGGSKEKRRTSKYTLQRLSNFRPDGDNVEKWTNRQWLAAAAAADNWRDVYSIGSGELEFSDNVRDAAFEPSRRTYYRIKSEPVVAGLPCLYSDPVVVAGYTAVANISNDVCEILELSNYDDGKATRVVVGFTRTYTGFLAVQDPPRNPKDAKLYEKTSTGSVVDGDGTRYAPTQDTTPMNNKTYYEQLSSGNRVLNSNGTEITWAEVGYAWRSNMSLGKMEIYDSDTAPTDRLAYWNKEKEDANGNTVYEHRADIEARIAAGFTLWNVDALRKNPPSVPQGSKTKHFHSVYLTNLEIGKSYYIRARRFLKGADNSTDDLFGSYGKFIQNKKETRITPRSRPKKVRLSAPSVLAYGSSVDLSWAFDDVNYTENEMYTTMPQQKYQIWASKIENNKLTPKTMGGEVTDSATSTTVSWSTIETSGLLAGSISSENKGKVFSIYFLVKVMVGGTYSDFSNAVLVTFVQQPTASLTLSSSTLTALPLKATLRTNDSEADAVIRIVNESGCATWMPYGKDWQPAGTVVYSKKFKPDWKPDPNNKGMHQYVWSSEGLDIDFRDGAQYKFSFRARHTYSDDINGNESMELYDAAYAKAFENSVNDEGFQLASVGDVYWGGSTPMNYDISTDEYPFDDAMYDKRGVRVYAAATFDVSWSRKAPVIPALGDVVNGEKITTGYMDPPTLSSEGVTFTIPTAWKSKEGTSSPNDRIDLYRVTPDGAYLVKSGIRPGSTVTDTKPMYSNYANCRYRVAVRTLEGDVDWKEVPAGTTGHCVRFDWGDEESENHGGYSYLELPYNLSWTDQWTKNSRVQLHMDGTYAAYWRGGVDRRNSLSTAMLKFEDPEQVERVRALAQFPGPVYVRLPDGCAFCANVEVNSLQNTYDSQILTCSFSAQEIAMIPQYADNAVTVIDPNPDTES